MSEPGPVIVDRDERRRALDVGSSFIVQAPAGSGKTELLIQRILALLGGVGQPEEILAITFTRKAAAEMHRRLLEALEAAEFDVPPAAAHAAATWTLARAARRRDVERGWQLTANPSRLQVMTIDSFCALLVRRMPWLSRFGDPPAISDVPDELYREAADRLLAGLDAGKEGADDIACLLAHLDNQVPLLRDLVVAMLGRRDQWLRHLDPASTDTIRPELERALQRHIAAALQSLGDALGPERLVELHALGVWAAANLGGAAAAQPLAPLDAGRGVPSATTDHLAAWLALAHLVLTAGGEVRRSLDRRLGFPADGSAVARGQKERMAALLDDLRATPEVVARFRALRELPAVTYADEQWRVLAALVRLLPLAVRELREVFRARSAMDFAEVSRGALAALGDDLAPGDLLLSLDSRLRHILVDEFQDTSHLQFELLARLTSGWTPGDGRTLFLVGDPMQSIYRFREAEVGLFLRLRRRGFETVPLTPLVLQANFRSQGALVGWFNTVFAETFPLAADEIRGAVPYAPARPVHAALDGPAVTLTCFAERDDAAEAAQIVALIRAARADEPGGTVAVLVRSRAHLAALIPALKTAGLGWQAQEIDPLTSRPAIQDLLALVRALLHPADRVAWLAVLRAPWAGLQLDDLLALCGSDPDATIWECLVGPNGQPPLLNRLSADGRERLERIVPVLARARDQRGRVPLRRLVEAAWLGLYGPAGLTAADLADAEQFFSLLEQLDEGGDLVRLETLEERLDRLFAAADPLAGPELQLMTIHKAKGLEFDTVILPGLGRPVGTPERSLLLWQEVPEPLARSGEGLLLAPLPALSRSDQDATYRAIDHIHRDKDALETVRLFYVAATRARKRLYLLGHARSNGAGAPEPRVGSLLHACRTAFAPLTTCAAPVTAAADSGASPRDFPLRRLPPEWRLPLFAAPLKLTEAAASRPSETGHRREQERQPFSLRAEDGRIIGTVVHGWLERLARDGLQRWPEERLAGCRPQLEVELVQSGVPRSRVPFCAERALTALVMTAGSERGRWMLQRHRDAGCELALTGVLDGVLVPAIIDRTFIDADGVRWLIDYKVSAPGEEEEREAFLRGEEERYRPQLEAYRRLLALRAPGEQVRMALYFPLIDAWRELT